MARIIENTEDHGLHRIRPLGTRPNSKGGAVTAAAAEIGELLGCKYLITFTTSGDSTRRLSRVRPRIPMLAFTPNQWTRSQLALTWGVETFLVPDARHTDEMAMQVDEVLLAAGRVRRGRQRGHRRGLAPRHPRLHVEFLVTFTTSGDSTSTARPGPAADPDARLHPEPVDAQPARADLGRLSPFPRRRTPGTPTRMAMQVDEVLLAAGRVVEGDNRDHRSPARPPASPAPPTPCASTASGTPRTGSRPPTATSRPGPSEAGGRRR